MWLAAWPVRLPLQQVGSQSRSYWRSSALSLLCVCSGVTQEPRQLERNAMKNSTRSSPSSPTNWSPLRPPNSDLWTSNFLLRWQETGSQAKTNFLWLDERHGKLFSDWMEAEETFLLIGRKQWEVFLWLDGNFGIFYLIRWKYLELAKVYFWLDGVQVKLFSHWMGSGLNLWNWL